jgi:Domain of unknown function (DUF4291)
MQPRYEVRAQYDEQAVVVYQAYSPAIAIPAVKANRFVPPFSLNRMTWIKPSFLWLMHRSNWARKTGQEHILAVRMSREGWDEALAQAVLTTADPTALGRARVHVQWDPERSLRGAPLNHYSIQVGVGRALIGTFADDWVLGITDITPQVHKIARLIQTGQAAKARRFLPPERSYPVTPAANRLLISH